LTEPTKFGVIHGDKKEPCLYCGEPEHSVPLACPRIESIYVSPQGNIECIEFRADWEPPKLAG